MRKVEKPSVTIIGEALLNSKNNLRPILNNVNEDHTGFVKSDNAYSVHHPWSQSLLKPPPAPMRRPCSKLHMSDDHLGYDWIAAMLDNQQNCTQMAAGDPPPNAHWLQHSELFDTVLKFRQSNYDVCCSQDTLGYNTVSGRTSESLDQARSISTGSRIRARIDKLRPVRALPVPNNNRSSDSPLIFSYTLNTRLFPIPSDLATCERPLPLPGQDHILRVTVPLHYFRHPPELLRKIIMSRSSTQGTARSLLDTNSLSNSDSRLPFSPFVHTSPTVAGTMSLTGHCYPKVNQNGSSHRRQSNVHLRPRSRARVPTLDKQSSCAITNEDSAYLPRWLRHQPETEREAIASMLKMKNFTTSFGHKDRTNLPLFGKSNEKVV